MDWYLSELEASRRHHDLLCQAEISRLLEPVHRDEEAEAEPRSRLMYWLGSRLVESGRKLQTQYK
jgi:hypothetical protein